MEIGFKNLYWKSIYNDNLPASLSHLVVSLCKMLKALFVLVELRSLERSYFPQKILVIYSLLTRQKHHDEIMTLPVMRSHQRLRRSPLTLTRTSSHTSNAHINTRITHTPVHTCLLEIYTGVRTQQFTHSPPTVWSAVT